MKRQDFIFIAGFEGKVAIVNAKLRKKYSNYTTAQLMEEGLYSAAFRSALHSENVQEQQELVQFLQHNHYEHVQNFEDLMLVFGVFSVPDKKQQIKSI